MNRVIFCGDLEGKVISQAQCELARSLWTLTPVKTKTVLPPGWSRPGRQ